MAVKHAFNSAVADGADATLVRPSNWNEDHTVEDNTLVAAKLSATAADKVFGRITAGAGAGEELTGANLRAIAGLDTTDSPQFAAVNLGHATDTTLGRTSAGVANIEGKDIYVVGGTDVAGADGGTGSSTVAGALAYFVLDKMIQTHIEGLQVTWVSASAVTVKPGSAYVQNVDAVVNVTADQAMTGLSLGNSVWGYVYLLNDGTVECNTTAPAAPYSGDARSKTSDTSRRFLSACKTDSSGNIIQFQHDTASGLVMMRRETTGVGRVLSAGNSQATAPAASINCAAAVPPTAINAFLRLSTAGSAVAVYWASNDEASILSTSINYISMAANLALWATFPLDAAQKACYFCNGASGAAYMDIYGYFNRR